APPPRPGRGLRRLWGSSPCAAADLLPALSRRADKTTRHGRAVDSAGVPRTADLTRTARDGVAHTPIARNASSKCLRNTLSLASRWIRVRMPYRFALRLAV